MSDLAAILKKFDFFDSAETGFGPEHPDAPDPDLAPDIDRFLRSYPILTSDDGYVRFLLQYAGLLFTRDRDYLALSIYGFDPNVSLCLIDDDADVLSANGYIAFADITVPRIEGSFSKDDPLGAAFAFDAVGKRRRGVYRSLFKEEFVWYSSSFEDWLNRLADLRGRWIP